MGPVLQGAPPRPTTTEAVRRAIQPGQESLRALARWYNASPPRASGIATGSDHIPDRPRGLGAIALILPIVTLSLTLLLFREVRAMIESRSVAAATTLAAHQFATALLNTGTLAD